MKTFFCLSHLEDISLDEQSQKDSRYCTFCQPVIEYEYQLMVDRQGKPLHRFYNPVQSNSEVLKEGDVIMGIGEEKGLFQRTNSDNTQALQKEPEIPIIPFLGRPRNVSDLINHLRDLA